MPSASQRRRRSRAAASPGANGSAASGSGAAGISPGVQRRRHGQRPRGAVHLAPLEPRPAAVERAEDRERPAVAGARHADVGDEVAGMADGRYGGVDAPVARHRERGDVGGEVDGLRTRLLDEVAEHALGAAAAHEQLAAALAQRCAQLAQALEQEPRAVGRREAAGVQQPRVEHEHGDDAVGLAVRRGERGVVVHAQVAPEPDDRRPHLRGYGAAPLWAHGGGGTLRAWPSCATSRSSRSGSSRCPRSSCRCTSSRSATRR